MPLKHSVQISVANRSGQIQQVLKSRRIRLPKRLLKLLIGNFCEVLVLTPGQSVQSVEIHEARGGKADEQNERVIRRDYGTV